MVLTLAASLRDIDNELNLVRQILLLVGPLALVAIALAAWFLAGRALAPVEQIREANNAITADRLHERLPVPVPHDELGMLSITINHMMERIEKTFQELRRFTADASHELRTPLTSIRAEAEVALTGPLDRSTAEGVLASIVEECDRMTQLTEQLLLLTREDAVGPTSRMQFVDLAELTRRVAETLRPLAEARGLTLTCHSDDNLDILADECRIRQVLVNLIDNAIKYSKENGHIAVRAHRADGNAVIAVADNGIGIPRDHLARVFDRFYRVDKTRSRESGGAGLGLSIVKSIVTAHSGKIDIESTEGNGTTVRVRLALVATA